MTTLLDKFNQTQTKKDIPDFRPGDTIRVHQQIKEADKERIQVFEGTVIARKGKLGPNASFTVRKISGDTGVEKVFPLHLPSIKKIEVTRKGKVRRAKLYYLRERLGRKRKVKERVEDKSPHRRPAEEAEKESEEEVKKKPEAEEKKEK